MPKLPKNADIDVSIVMKDGVFIGGTFDNDPHVNPKAWDDKVWEVIVALCHNGSSNSTVHGVDSFAQRITAAHWGERPQEEEEE